MYRSSCGRSSPSSCSRSQENRSSGSRTAGACMSASTRGRSPRRSPSPQGRRYRSPSSSRSSRRSPSPRRTSRVRSPSEGSQSRRGSEQRDGSLSRRYSPRRHSYSSQRHPQFLGSCSPSRHSESAVEQNLWTEFNSDFYGIDPREQRRLSDRLGSPDSRNGVDRGYLDNDPVFIRGLSRSPSLEQYRSHSHQESPPSSFSTRHDKDYRGRDAFFHQSEYNMNEDCLEDLPREFDRDGKLFIKSLHPLKEERLNPKRPRYDKEDRQLDVSIEPQGSLPEERNYYKQRLSSQMDLDEHFRQLVSSRRNREENDLSKNTCEDCPDTDYVIHGLTNSLQPSESQYLYRPEDAPAMPKKSILKKRVDDPTMQNPGSSFRKKEYQESILEPADLHERASQDGSGISHILGMMADSASTQEKRRHSFLDVNSEDKFFYGDDEDDSNINCPTEKVTMNGGEESVSLNRRLLSPLPSIKPDNSEESGIEYEKIHDLLKTIGLDIELAEIGKGAARTQERLHGKKTLRSLDGYSHKAESSEKDSIQSNIHSTESYQKKSLSPCGSSQSSNDVPSASISTHAKSKTLEYDNSADPPDQSFPSVPVTPSAPPLLPNLPPPPPPVSQYSLPHFSAFLAAQVLKNYPPPTMAPPSYNAYRQCMAYSAPAWPMYAPPQQSNPTLPDVHRLASVTMPLQPTRSNLRVIETVSTVKENPEIKRNKSVLVEVPITPTDSKLVSQSSSSGTTERISDGKNLASEKSQEFKLGESMPTDEECNKGHGVAVQSGNNSSKTSNGVLLQSNLHCELSQKPSTVKLSRRKQKRLNMMTKAQHERENAIIKTERLKAEQKAQQKKLQYLKTELERVTRQQGLMLKNKRRVSCKDPLLRQVNRAQRNIRIEIARLQECLNKNPFCKEKRNLDHQAELTLNQETECGQEQKQCEEQKEAKDEGSTKMARKEELEITKELGEEVDENDSKGKEGSYGQKLTIRLTLKKDNIQVEKEEGEAEESQKEPSQSSSEKCNLRKTETDNQSREQDVSAPKAESVEEGKCRESKSQSGSPDSKQKIMVIKTHNLGMRTKERKTARVANMQQQFKSFDSLHCPQFTLPPTPPLSLFPLPSSGLSYNMHIPPFSDSLLFTLHRATEERKQNF
ncbi:zinc finger protein 318-like [Heteronotia binoei]|uniref:zinc finger protein 318-like n=1 Tax=Heteronotia binoei TaxID=13085 RepID=UPI00292CD7B9|nr:zinc finger protein 318-like [Heteronotia binoei]